MFLKNYYLALQGATRNSGSSIFPKQTDGSTANYLESPTSALAFGGSASSYNAVNLKRVKTKLGGSSNYGGVIFGTGTTPPTIDDYKLSGDVVGTISYTSSVEAVSDESELTYNCKYTLTNTGDTGVTIGEIAMVCCCRASAGYEMLLERTVLDTPLVIPAGGIGVVTYTVSQKLPII